MAVFKDIQEARDFFQGDRFAMESGVVLEELGDGYSVCSLALYPAFTSSPRRPRRASPR